MNRSDLEVYRWHAVADERTLQQLAIGTIVESAALAIRERG